MYDAGVRKALSTVLVCKTPRSSQRAAMDDMPQKHSRERTNRIGAWEICSLTRGAWLDFCKRSITPTLGGTPTEKSSRTVRYAHSSRTRSSNPLRSSVPVTDLSRGEGGGKGLVVSHQEHDHLRARMCSDCYDSLETIDRA